MHVSIKLPCRNQTPLCVENKQQHIVYMCCKLPWDEFASSFGKQTRCPSAGEKDKTKVPGSASIRFACMNKHINKHAKSWFVNMAEEARLKQTFLTGCKVCLLRRKDMIMSTPDFPRRNREVLPLHKTNHPGLHRCFAQLSVWEIQKGGHGFETPTHPGFPRMQTWIKSSGGWLGCYPSRMGFPCQ